LPQRVRGAARSAPAPSAPSSLPSLSEELRQRLQAAVQAERSEAASQEGATEPTQVTAASGSAGGGDVAAKPAKQANGHGKRSAKPAPAAQAQPVAKAAPETKPEPAAKPQAEPVEEGDELTEWLRPLPAGSEAAPALPKPAMHGHGGIVRREPAAPPAETRRPALTRPDAAKKARRRRRGARVALRVAIVVLVIGALAVAAVRHFARAPQTGRTGAAVARQQAAARNEAAAWVAGHVRHDAIVSCDPVMCAALTAHGFPSRDLLALGSTSPVPDKSAVVVETAAVEDLFGSSLATAWAPTVLASFGSGQATTTVRVIAPHGAAAYQTALNADLAARKTAGAGLLNDPQITVPVLAREQLTAGQVDSRLLLALADLGSRQPMIIVQFGNDGPGATADVPLPFVDLAENVQAAHLGRAGYVKAVRAYLSTVTKFRPATMTTLVLADGQAVLRVEFAAPSPLGVFGP
jgi:hypothetical protein